LERPSRIANINYESVATLMVGPAGQLRLSLPGARGGMLFGTADGQLLWKDDVNGPHSFFVADRYFTPKSFHEAATARKSAR